jgi:hypothetical protein
MLPILPTLAEQRRDTNIGALQVGNAKPVEVSMRYDIRLHNPKMFRLAMRIVGTAKPVRVTQLPGAQRAAGHPPG